jgi:acetyl-CoA acetyltransferase family protein
MVKKSGVDPLRINELIFSSVLHDPRIPNLGREIVLRTGLPKSLVGQTVSNNCISGLLAVAVAYDGIRSGRLHMAAAGGVESMSNPSLTFSRRGEQWFLELHRKRKLLEKLLHVRKFRPSFLLPQAPSPKEPSTGMTMGEHCELMAQEFGIGREPQDQLALRSHERAMAGADNENLRAFITPVGSVTADNMARSDTSLEKLSRLKPVFDRSSKGTLTAGNSSAFTDGASCVLMGSESEVTSIGRDPLCWIDAIEFAAVPPGEGLLMAPGVAVLRLLNRLKLSFEDLDVFEIHEAFSAQVLANAHVWEHGWQRYPELNPVGALPWNKVNLFGGSIALGHPFAATGGRLILHAAEALRQRGRGRALISVCAAGGAACAMVVSR